MRSLLAFAFLAFAAAPAAAQPTIAHNPSLAERAAALRPGQYVWDARAASPGELFVVIDLTAQRATVYRDGLIVGASTISTGSEGRETPTGVFTVLQKEVMHRSSTYDNAPMPHMQRLTWKGVAMHSGDLPGYAASHGCIRFPKEFAKQLYEITKIGTPVMITDAAQIAEQERRAAEYQRAQDIYAQTLAEQQTAANRAVVNHQRAKAAHEEQVRQHEMEMARYKAALAAR